MYDRNITRGIHFRKSGVNPSRINEIIQNGYKSIKREDKIRQKQTFAPSSIAYGHGTCPRYWYLAFEGKYEFKDNNDAMALANMENGIYFHDRFAKVLQASGKVISIEEEIIIESPPIRGFIDAIIDVDGEQVVVEAKSSKQEWFVIKENSMKPSANHLYQIIIYIKGKGIKNGVLIYENKNDQSTIVIPVTIDEHNEKIVDQAFEWMREVYKNWQDQNIPTRPWTQKNKNCKGCPLFDECWNSLPAGDMKMLPMEVVKL